MIRKIILLSMMFIGFSCSSRHEISLIYSGRIEAETVQLSAKIAGVIDTLYIREGDAINIGQRLAKINADRYQAQKRQQFAQLKEIRLNQVSIDDQIRQITPQLTLARDNLKKMESLFINGAAKEQDRDELKVKVNVLQAQLDGLLTAKKITACKEEQMSAYIEITELNLKDAWIISPLKGRVINCYHRLAESVVPGINLFEVADLTWLQAMIYVPLEDLNCIRLGQKVSVHAEGVIQTVEGQVSWISSESEFTPKTILTKETRSTLVYAVKVMVPNADEILKIGMPVDVEIL